MARHILTRTALVPDRLYEIFGEKNLCLRRTDFCRTFARAWMRVISIRAADSTDLTLLPTIDPLSPHLNLLSRSFFPARFPFLFFSHYSAPRTLRPVYIPFYLSRTHLRAHRGLSCVNFLSLSLSLARSHTLSLCRRIGIDRALRSEIMNILRSRKFLNHEGIEFARATIGSALWCNLIFNAWHSIFWICIYTWEY